ncbi:hypothetical protein JTB14_006768 [Gonioctena quinquepunctata]|nr:hypothetical protein JTB14_006768 [Gonioctena quinquepunctata]
MSRNILIIKTAQKESPSENCSVRGESQPFWWNQKIADLRDRTNAARRSMTRRRQARNRNNAREEMFEAAKRLKNRKAAGHDSIIPEIVKLGIECQPEKVICVLNRSLQWSGRKQK